MAHGSSRIECIGILTAGGDCPGLNAAIRGVTKTAIQDHGMKVIGIYDGFRGLVENRIIHFDHANMSNVLTQGGTILGTSRDKPKKMRMGDRIMDMTSVAVENARGNGMDCLVCLGGGGTQKNALHLHQAGGLDVLTLPKTIDNDVGGTDVTFGFDTAMTIAAEAIDRLHTTATSHDRIIVVEVMGHNTGWLALGAGIASGADVILMPEIPYDIDVVRDFLLERQRRFGKKFSIVVVAEGSMSREQAVAAEALRKKVTRKKTRRLSEPVAAARADELPGMKMVRESLASSLARQLQSLTHTETRITSLGHVQRGGVPSPADRLLSTRMGVAAAHMLADGVRNAMVAVRGSEIVPVPLEEVAAMKKTVPLDHPWIDVARSVGTCLGIPADQLPR